MNRLAITRTVINGKDRLVFAALNEKRKLEDLEIWSEENSSLLDRIYIGRVENIVPNINAAFVRILPDVIAYLPLDKQENVLFTKKNSKKPGISAGDEILVQVVKDAIKTKQAVLSTKLTIHGNYCLLTSGDSSCSVSKKLDKELAQHLRGILLSVMSENAFEHPYGLLARTDASHTTDAIFAEDAIKVIGTYREILSYTGYRKAPAEVLRNPSPVIQKIKTVDISSFDLLYTDQEDIYTEVAKLLPVLEEEKKLHLYKDEKLPLSVLYGIDQQIEKLCQRQVWLKSGANLIIEQLETLTFIDINTAKNIGGREDISLSVNLEAAEEIARQIRLRNLSGMILVDFINMKSEEDENTLIRFLKKEIAKDPVTTSFADITKLGLVELTRKKVYKSLREIL